MTGFSPHLTDYPQNRPICRHTCSEIIIFVHYWPYFWPITSMWPHFRPPRPAPGPKWLLKNRFFPKTTVGSAVLDCDYQIFGGKVCPRYEGRDPASRPRDRDFDGKKGASAGENHPKLFLACYSYLFLNFIFLAWISNCAYLLLVFNFSNFNF